jgi:beta-glucosidase
MINSLGSAYGGIKNILWGNNLLGNAVQNSQVSQSRLDDMVTRILASWYLTKQDAGYPAIAINQNTNNGGPNVQGSGAAVAKSVARDGIVLLKNIANTLPLKTPKSMAIIGSHAVANPKGINSCVDSK